MSRPVSRVLSLGRLAALAQVTTILLRLPLPTPSSGPPAGSDGPSSNACAGRVSATLSTLLQVGFTEPPESPPVLVVSYTTVSPLPPGEPDGGLFSVALSRGSPRVGVTHHLALWSPDFPRRTGHPARRGRLVDSSVAPPRYVLPALRPRATAS